MSGYWDAVGRAALGLPGSAGPRPRSIFEPDTLGLPDDALPEADEEVEARAVSTPPPAAVAASSERLVERGDPSRSAVGGSRPISAEEQPATTGVAEPARAERRAPDRDSAPPAAPVRSAPDGTTPAPHTIERIEVLRFESPRPTSDIVPTIRPGPPAQISDRAQALTPTASDAPAPPASAEPDRKPEPVAEQLMIAEPRKPEHEPVAEASVPKVPPPLVIEIDRIDIRIEPETAPPVGPLRRDRDPVLSLAEYLSERSDLG